MVYLTARLVEPGIASHLGHRLLFRAGSVKHFDLGLGPTWIVCKINPERSPIRANIDQFAGVGGYPRGPLVSEHLALRGELQTGLPECSEGSSQNQYSAEFLCPTGQLKAKFSPMLDTNIGRTAEVRPVDDAPRSMVNAHHAACGFSYRAQPAVQGEPVELAAAALRSERR